MSKPIGFDQYDAFLRQVKDRIAAPVAVSEYAHVLPSPDELRMAIDEGRRAFLQATT